MLLQIHEIQLTIAIGSLIIIFFTVIIIVTITQYKQRIYKHQLEKEQLEASFSKTLLQSKLEIKEQTLQHIAWELHDNLGQVASLIKIHLNTLSFENAPAARQKVEHTKELVRQLISDLKSISLNLNSDRVVQLGLRKGLESEVERLNKTGRFEAFLHEEGVTPSLDPNTTILLYRMVQEMINNSVKHSGAKQITISLQGSENLFTLVCADNGVGFNVEEKLKSGGSGLINLHNRVRLINGQIIIQSSHESGTSVTIELPL
jgi:signal transduction histidine kinase